jgi:large subunit ribosomal protein L31
MKKKGHPTYREVLFVDTSTGFKFVCGSTLNPKEKEVFEGKEYPKFEVAISSSSHPFFTKSKQYIDTEGRVEKFTKKYKNKRKIKEKAKEAETPKPTEAKKKVTKKVLKKAKTPKRKAKIVEKPEKE